MPKLFFVDYYTRGGYYQQSKELKNWFSSEQRKEGKFNGKKGNVLFTLKFISVLKFILFNKK